MLSKVYSAGLLGIESYPIEIEVDVNGGLPTEVVVGLPAAVVKESRDRVRTAISNSGFSYPVDKITVNLASADVKKEGPSFDLPPRPGVGPRGKGRNPFTGSRNIVIENQGRKLSSTTREIK